MSKELIYQLKELWNCFRDTKLWQTSWGIITDEPN